MGANFNCKSMILNVFSLDDILAGIWSGTTCRFWRVNTSPTCQPYEPCGSTPRKSKWPTSTLMLLRTSMKTWQICMYTSNHYVKISVTFIYFTKTVNFIMVVHVCWLYICITCVLIVYVCCTFVLHGCWLYMCVECTCVLGVHVC